MSHALAKLGQPHVLLLHFSPHLKYSMDNRRNHGKAYCSWIQLRFMRT